MSADNFLGIYRQGKKYIGRGCWSECERDKCANCESRKLFETTSLEKAIKLANEEMGKDIYEYGITFLNS